jgi:hypothetical protein
MRRIWGQVDMIEDKNIMGVVLLAVGEWVLARYLLAVA